MSDERRQLKRSKFSYYMRVFDSQTQKLIGYLTDISPQGFKLDCPELIPVNRDCHLRMDLTGEIASQTSIAFTARCRWSQPDRADPFSYIAGFQLLQISALDNEIFQRIVAKYGSAEPSW